MAKTAQMTVRVEENVKLAIEKAAAEEERSVAQWIERALKAALARIEKLPE